MAKTVAAIDGNSLMHRAYHAIPPTMTDGEGRPTNAVFGFLSMVLKFYDDVRPDAVICAFDAGKPTFRIEELETYKAQRPPMDDDLRVQFPIIEELLEAMAVPIVKVEGWEGDDILGTIAARDEAEGFETLIVTGDKDACQLASPLTRIVNTRKGITDVLILGPAEVEERYGVTPEQFCDYLGLMGDASDNIPGVPGIGPKTASRLLQRFGSIEGVYEGIDELKGKQRQNLEDHRDLAFLSRRIATIVRDLDFPLDIVDLAFPRFDVDEVTAAFRKYRLASHLNRVLELSPDAPRASTAVVFDPGTVHGDEAAAAWLEDALAAEEPLSIAIVKPEQESLFEDTLIVAVRGADASGVFHGEAARAALGEIVTGGTYAALHCKEVLQQLYPPDSSREALIDEATVLAHRGFDLALAAYALQSSRSDYTLATLVEAHLGAALPESDTPVRRALTEAAAVQALWEPLARALETDGSERAYHDIDGPLVGVLAQMERTGVALDCERIAQVGAICAEELEALTAEIHRMAGEEFNIDSPKQLAHILFEVLELPPIKRNRRGYSTDASVLTELAKTYELPKLVLRYRELSKMKSTYIDALPTMRSAGDGRIHTTFHETVTTTGRLSSSDPNLQNIPVRTEFGRQIRECFTALGAGDLFLAADYSQIELRVLAHLSGDEHLIHAFCSGADFHRQTAARVFGVDVDAVTPEMRRRAKAVNFGIVYGQQAYGLSQSLDIPFGEAKEMIERYFEAYPGVRSYLDEIVARATERGWSETMFGRKRHIPELRASNAARRGFGERTAMNHPMQGSAADIIKLAMRRVADRLAADGFAAQLMLQVHDELDFSVPPDEVERLADVVREIMESVVALDVPLVVDISWGDNWAAAH